MQTNISEPYNQLSIGKLANDVLRSCVHCGFCNATCPTYQLLGDELDGPRGRIYLIKQVMEGKEATNKTKQHLDRCLNCLNCETTCPSGVTYHHLLEVGQKVVNQQVQLPLLKRLLRSAVLELMPYPKRFDFLINLGLFLKPVMPKRVASLLPHRAETEQYIEVANEKNQSNIAIEAKQKMLLIGGCVHNSIAPTVHAKSIAVFQQLGIELVLEKNPSCCGALTHHLQAEDKTLNFVKTNCDKWDDLLNQGFKAVISNASGCGVMIKDYPHYIELNLGKDSTYYKKAKRIAAVTLDVSEILNKEDLGELSLKEEYKQIAYHPPCTLQHGQKLPEVVEKLLVAKGATLTPIKDKHLCCGSAGTYSLFNPEISYQLRDNKLNNLQQHSPDVIATANIGCLHHLQSASNVPVIHWLELFK